MLVPMLLERGIRPYTRV